MYYNTCKVIKEMLAHLEVNRKVSIMRNSRVIIYTDLDSIALKDKAYSFSKRVNLKHCDRLSFYGKAKKATEGRYTALFSYDTLICVYDKAANTLHVGKYWNYSATTRRHEMSFLDDLFDNSMSNPQTAYDVYDRLREG